MPRGNRGARNHARSDITRAGRRRRGCRQEGATDGVSMRSKATKGAWSLRDSNGSAGEWSLSGQHLMDGSAQSGQRTAAHRRRRRLRLLSLSLSPSEPLLSPDPILCGLCGAAGPHWLARVEPLQLCGLICALCGYAAQVRPAGLWQSPRRLHP
jgi:hypothetical protein